MKHQKFRRRQSRQEIIAEEIKAHRQEVFMTDEKGRRNEIRFRHLFSNPAIVPSWISKVEDAGRKDDWENGIDFFVSTSTGWRIPVDVKSSYAGLQTHVAKRGREAVCVVVMEDKLTDERMRRKVLKKLVAWQENAIRRGVTPTTGAE